MNKYLNISGKKACLYLKIIATVTFSDARFYL